MLTLPDFREKQILFIQADNKTKNKIRFENDNIVFEKDEIVVNRASCHKVFAVFVMGDMTITTGILREGARLGVSFFFMKTNFNSYAEVGSLAQGNYLLRSTQYTMSEGKEMVMSKMLVVNKIKNQIKLLEKSGTNDEILNKIGNLVDLSLSAKDCESLLGVEGNASRVFFGGYFKNLKWLRRTPRTRQDIPNFLMDIGYTLLFNFIDALLNVYGFDTYKGVYHKLFFQRKSLSCDIVEPFRCIIDRQILKSFNLKQINEKDFVVRQGKYELDYLSSQKYSRIFMEAIMERKEDIFLFVQGFYRHFMNDDKYPFPIFDI
ncbi:MAG: type V CRISPR-associated endonuclease Cas1, partial [bacterium]|nr:type V CRISPR-associated endonuclease Cas1 [bacterium]